MLDFLAKLLMMALLLAWAVQQRSKERRLRRA